MQQSFSKIYPLSELEEGVQRDLCVVAPADENTVKALGRAAGNVAREFMRQVPTKIQLEGGKKDDICIAVRYEAQIGASGAALLTLSLATLPACEVAKLDELQASVPAASTEPVAGSIAPAPEVEVEEPEETTDDGTEVTGGGADEAESEDETKPEEGAPAAAGSSAPGESV